jgi:hypothetical protein
MATYERWTSADGTEAVLLPSDHPERDALIRGTDGAPLLLREVFEAADWDAACRHRDARSGWSSAPRRSRRSR